MASTGKHLRRQVILYISYDGILEPLGYSQVFSYLRGLSEKGWLIHLISYEKKADWENHSLRTEVTDAILGTAIHWHPLPYHKRLSALATAYDILCGLVLSTWLCITQRVAIVHARSYVASVIALLLKRFLRIRFIFDMRGFWVDERVDGGIWKPNSLLFRISKWFERRFFLRADVVISLTHAGVREIKQFSYLNECLPRFEVIPTCTNLDLFRPSSNQVAKQQDPNQFVLGYVGSAGIWYLFEPVLECFRILTKHCTTAKLLVLNRGEHTLIRKLVKKAQIPIDQVELLSASYSEIPAHMNRMDAGIFFIKPVFSKKASAPTKLGEFLGCGVPCLSNSGVGDVEEILGQERVGVVLRTFSAEEYEVAIGKLLAITAESQIERRCREVAQRYFSLECGVQAYDRIYSSLAADK